MNKNIIWIDGAPNTGKTLLAQWIWSAACPSLDFSPFAIHEETSFEELAAHYEQKPPLVILEIQVLQPELLPFLLSEPVQDQPTILISSQRMPKAFDDIAWSWTLPKRDQLSFGQLIHLKDLKPGDCIVHNDRLVVVDEIIDDILGWEVVEQWISRSGKLKHKFHGPFEEDKTFIHVGHYSFLRDHIQKEHDSDAYHSTMIWLSQFNNTAKMLRQLDGLIHQNQPDSLEVIL